MIDKNPSLLRKTINTKNKNYSNNNKIKIYNKEYNLQKNNNVNENILIKSNFQDKNYNIGLYLNNIDETLKNNLFSIPINNSITNLNIDETVKPNINMDETVKQNKDVIINYNNNHNNNSCWKIPNISCNLYDIKEKKIYNNDMKQFNNNNSNDFYESDLISSEKEKSLNINESETNPKNIIHLKLEKNEDYYLSNNNVVVNNFKQENKNESQKKKEDTNTNIQNKLNNFILKNVNGNSNKSNRFSDKKFVDVLDTFLKK